ncbi:MAG: four helix bundle protein [Flavobacteriales bacterium]|nr:four helix bundle protein [Flavobacteriales bacterium]
MATIQKFEDIQAWQNARELTKLVYNASKKGDFAKDFGLRDQIRRACVSILSNIAEGYERNNNKVFIQFLLIAKASTGEVRAQLYAAVDQEYIDAKTFADLKQRTEDLSVQIGKLTSYLETYIGRRPK